MASDIKELNQRVHNLNKRVKMQNNNWDNLIERMDKRYVNEGEFYEFRRGVDTRLESIDKNIHYLITLQTGK